MNITWFVALCLVPFISTAQVSIVFDKSSKQVSFGAEHIAEAIGQSAISSARDDPDGLSRQGDITIRVVGTEILPMVHQEGFNIENLGTRLVISAIDEAGAMYGALDVAEQIKMGLSWEKIASKTVNPRFSVRAVKFNLPWSPYRNGEAMDRNVDVCRDLGFWKKFIDQMAENRFNLLSLWNVHPFSFMVKPANFPGANDFSEKEMAEWKNFWTSLFRMCRQRGIEPFIVNWNIAVSPEFARNYHVHERNDTSEIVKRYTREVVTQVINEYPDLAGIGVTLADWMKNMTPKSREDWIEQTVVEGIKNADHPVKLLHRSVLTASPSEMRRVIDNADLPDTTLVSIKFNWSHGHSTPHLALTHDSNTGKIDEGYWSPTPENFRIEWMVRNEDFFILRWGEPDFIRQHIALNDAPWVNGYFVGSEGYIPARDLSHLPGEHRNWDYAFEKQWLFYMLWGRLLYHPGTPDVVFEGAFDRRYGNHSGKDLLTAWKAASQMPLKLASFYRATWDYTLYSEGFLAPFSSGGLHDTVSSFISIDELIDHPTLDPDYLSIPDFIRLVREGKEIDPQKVTPPELANTLVDNFQTVTAIVEKLRPGASPGLDCELDDLQTWAYLSLYFADKLKAGVALHTYHMTGEKAEQQDALRLLRKCLETWKKLSRITAAHYRPVPYIDIPGSGAHSDASTFSWKKYLPEVKRDIQLAKDTEKVRQAFVKNR